MALAFQQSHGNVRGLAILADRSFRCRNRSFPLEHGALSLPLLSRVPVNLRQN